VTVLVLVLVLVLTEVLDSVVVVLVDGVVVCVLVDGGLVVSVTVWVGGTTAPDVVDVVVVVVVSVESDEPDIRLTTNHTIRATMSAMMAPNATSAAGLRYQGVGGSGGGPPGGCWP
jgi:hypothetical protein